MGFMHIKQWVAQLRNHPPIQSLFESPSGKVAWGRLAPEIRPLLVAQTYLQQPRKILIVCNSHEKALTWQARLALFGVPESHLRELPSGIASLFEDATPEAIALSDRIGALKALIDPEPGILIATPASALERTLPSDLIQEAFFTIAAGHEIDLDGLKEKLQRIGYEYAEPVRIPGQFSQRGGILDVYPMGLELPVRLDFFDTQIESIRFFDANTQRSVGKVDSVDFGPAREAMYPETSAMEAFVEMLERTLESEAATHESEAADRLRELVAGDVRALSQRVYFDRLELYRPLIHPDSPSALEMLPEDGLLVLDDLFELANSGERAEKDLEEALAARAKRGEILTATVGDFMLPIGALAAPQNVWAMNSVESIPAWFKPDTRRNEEVISGIAYRGQPAYLVQSIQTWLSEGYTVVAATDQPNRAKAMLEQVELFPRQDESEVFNPGLHLISGNTGGGWVYPAGKCVQLSDQELFGVTRLKLPQRKFNEGLPISTVLDLKDGDYVVHINFGIGVFRGLVKRTQGGIEKEFLYIEYAAPDKLFVPADQLDRIQKYQNPGDNNPKLNRLAGGEWQRSVKKAREEAREYARDLTRLYAQRKTAQRAPFGLDSPWQAEMEGTFPYVETPTQMKAILEVKEDLNLDYPMDRLVCGDVGFGKTEVAIRAAFKVVQSGRQVAVLCPTTILSEQHFRNFQERLAAFPVRMALLNRFVSPAEKRDILTRLEHGEIDLVIGTHGLLSESIEFHALGLVIIDEEQKFGVKQKEMLKKLRVSVDVLTLSATPIPRTLSMALMDIRQMSLITDPPAGRLPVRTFVRPYSNEVVREAILRELSRGGQVYYVYNRVQGIHHIAERIRKLVPNAKIVVGHGQMNEKELEPVMVAFIKGEADILISTTIVESGLDIANANTLIVENADFMGLAQLYQLRGRVGRSDRQAYAYFLHDGQKTLTENAVGRLEALQEFTALGSGYNLAFRDLQIRGAGDLLGAKQHGTMASVGYDLFINLIAEEIKFLKAHADGDSGGAEYRDPLQGLEPLPTLDLPTKALIPEAYIPETAQRLYYYKTLMSARTNAELTEAEQQIADRYGRMPDEVKRVVWVMRLRLIAHGMGIEKIDGNGGRLTVTWYPSTEHNPRLWTLLNKKNRECYSSRGSFTWPYQGGPLAACERMLTTIQESIEELEAALASIEAR